MEAQEINTVPQWENICFLVHPQAQPGNVLFDLAPAVLQIFLVLMYQIEIVHVPPIIANTQLFFYEMVHARKIHDGEPL